MADAWGIEHRFINSNDEPQRVPEETIERIRAALGDPQPAGGPLVSEVGSNVDLGSGEVVLEDGGSMGAREAGRGQMPPGYHQLVDAAGRTRRLIVSPGRCYLPEGLRAWGWVAQLYGMRSRDSWGMGDLADLRRLATWSAGMGAGFTMISPVVAAAPTPQQQPNPYFPASRRFRNPIYLSVPDVPGADRAKARVEAGARTGKSLNRTDQVDRDAVWKVKLDALGAIWEAGPPPEAFESWLCRQPESLWRFAVWSVLAERHGSSWQSWPARYRRPDRDVVETVESSELDRMRFHAWLQWCLETQLANAGEELAIIQDLPIGFDPGGFDAWEWQDLLATELSVGAPPDAFNPGGQDWGSPPFIPWRLRSADYRPFIETVRANLASGGGLRIDHVMGLFRLWCIPDEATTPGEGAYVRYPAEDLLAIIALESQRARSLVVGEDLGTVEQGVRETLGEREMLSYRLLWFEPRPPSEWPENAMAAVTTHDLPTVAGLWEGSDIEDQRDLGLKVDEKGTARMRKRLAEVSNLGEGTRTDEAIAAAYRQLATAPSRLLAATLEDAVSEKKRPNMPGATGRQLNWRLALPRPLEELESLPLANRLAAILDEATNDGT